MGRPEPVVVAITWEDLCLEAIYQPNLEIAGSPRKVYRDRGMASLAEVEHWMGRRAQAILFNQTPNSANQKHTTQSHRAKLMRQKENSPDSRLRPLNLHSV